MTPDLHRPRAALSETAQLPAAMEAETNNSSEACFPKTSVPPTPPNTAELDHRSGVDAPLGRRIIEEISQTNQNFALPGTQKAENVVPLIQEMNDVTPSLQEIRSISLLLSNHKIEDISGSYQESKISSKKNVNVRDGSISSNEIKDYGKKEVDDLVESHKGQNGMKFVEKIVEEEKTKKETYEEERDEDLNETDLKREEDKELRKYNKKIPEERATVQKDEIEEHFDKLPWVFGALGRVLNLGIRYGPKFAPINIPLRRRLQTFAVFFWMSTFLFMGLGSTFFLLYLFFFTQYWWVSLCYLTWFLGDRSVCNRGGRRFEWLRRWCLWKHYRDFFPVHLIKTADLDPSKNYIMGYHPHGILSAGAFCHFSTEGSDFSKTFPGFTPYLLVLEGHFLLPFYRDFFMGTGAVSATRESMDYLLGREGAGRALCLVVGGAKESLDCHPNTVVLHLNKRKGFCKMALRHGASLVPMFSFGENEIYDQVSNPEGSFIRRFQNALQKIIGLAPCMFIGRGIFQYSFGIVPFRKPIYTVVGAPIDVPLVKNPTKEQIISLHETYVKSVIDLYNKYKQKYSEYPECEIKIV
ncbi:2-acylglycerol O-acyltransferase 1-like isoform X1 [Panulirus ornatus]|uniref:2-acylglycerol O-acyltransferase 1-like isoform X1 n=1 Tax=Panulirus ornatus TaxID=150431 RepID=UPI003A83AE68